MRTTGDLRGGEAPRGRASGAVVGSGGRFAASHLDCPLEVPPHLTQYHVVLDTNGQIEPKRPKADRTNQTGVSLSATNGLASASKNSESRQIQTQSRDGQHSTIDIP